MYKIRLKIAGFVGDTPYGGFTNFVLWTPVMLYVLLQIIGWYMTW